MGRSRESEKWLLNKALSPFAAQRDERMARKLAFVQPEISVT